MSAVLEFADRQFLQRVYRSAVDPVVGDDVADGFLVGDAWYNTATGNAFDCHSNAAGAAVWRHRPRTWTSGAAVSLTGSTAETALATVAIPAGAMGVNGLLRVTLIGSYPNSADDKTFRVRFGASGAGVTGTIIAAVVYTTTTGFREQREIQNRNSASSQVASASGFMTAAGWGTTTGAVATAAINTANASEVVISGQLETGSETLNLERYDVVLTRPDIGP